MKKTFRLGSKIKYQGMTFTAIFLAALIGCFSIFFLEDPAKHGFKGEHSVAVIGGTGVAFFGAMLLMSLYMWAAYYVERFTIDGTMLSIRSMLQDRQFDASELLALKWRSYPIGGGILFQVLGSTTRLDLQGFGKDDRLRIIRTLLELVPPQVQEGWPTFCHKVALPLRDGTPSTVRSEPSAVFYTITRTRYDRTLRFVLPLSVAAAIALWAWLDLWPFLALPFLVIAAWLLLRATVPPAGRSETRLTSTLHGRASIIGMGAVVTSQLLMIGLALLGFGKSVACWTALIVLVAAFPPMLYMLHKSDAQRRTADEQAAELAPTEWDQGEGAT